MASSARDTHRGHHGARMSLLTPRVLSAPSLRCIAIVGDGLTQQPVQLPQPSQRRPMSTTDRMPITIPTQARHA